MSPPTASPRRLFRARRRVTRALRNAYDARMKRIVQWAVVLACLARAAGAGAAGFNVNEPWVKPVAAGGSTDAYMELMSPEGATIVDARSPAAASVAVVTAKGRQAAPFAVQLPARKTVLLAEKATHLLLVRVERPLKVGDRVPITLVVRNADGSAQDVDVDAEVRRHSPSYDHGIGRAHHH
jgi:periplasmic copper chaperone A